MSWLDRPTNEVEEPVDESPAHSDYHDQPAEAPQQLFELMTSGGTPGSNPLGQVHHLPDLVGGDGHCARVTVHVEPEGAKDTSGR